MTKIITENFRVGIAKDFYESFIYKNDSSVNAFESELTTYNSDNSLSLTNTHIDDITDMTKKQIENVNFEDIFYIMASSIDSNTDIQNTQKEKREFLRRVIFGNKIDHSNMKYIFTNNSWTSNTVYDSFDDTVDIEDLNMFVSVLDGESGEGPYKIFKCIRNTGLPSTVEPSTSNLDSIGEVTLSDGYTWKYMFEVSASDYIEHGIVNGLPYVANNDVIDSAVENISDIVIENAIPNQFSDYIIGTSNNSTDTIVPSTIESVTLDNLSSNRYEIIIKTSIDIRTEDDAYVGMYLRIIDPGQAKAVYDILDTAVLPGNTNKLSVYVESDIDLKNVSPSLSNKSCDIVPKIEVSKTNGEQCIAYGELNSQGTLSYIHFVNKGSEYKYASAKLILPPALETQAKTELRVVVSPTGGHGSDPISEMGMSRISVVTNFYTDDLTNTPASNYYTKIGIVKNPTFKNEEYNQTFDNRISIIANTDFTSTVNKNYYVSQEVGDEVISARIHDLSYDSNTDQTTFYLVDYIGDFIGNFSASDAEIKESMISTQVESVTINNVSNTNIYNAFSGEILHFIDFDPIERREDRREKVKFIFDF